MKTRLLPLVLLFTFIATHAIAAEAPTQTAPIESSCEKRTPFRKRCGQWIGRIAMGGAVATASLLIHQSISNHQFRSRPTDTSVLGTRGASITSGTSASLSLLMRMRHHFQSSNVDLQHIMGDQKIMIMVDYFFPTHFPEMDQVSGSQLGHLVQERITDARTQNDYVLVGTLLNANQLSDAAKKRLKEQPESPINFIDQMLSSSDKRRQSIETINDSIRKMALADPHIIVIDVQRLAETLSVNGYTSPAGWTYQAPDLFPDKLHLNDNGQAVLFNVCIKPALETIPELAGRVPDMPMRNQYQQAVQTLGQFTALGKISTNLQTLAIEAQVKTAASFVQGEEGDYWATFGSDARKSLKQDTSRIFETAEQRLYSPDLENLRKIEAAIKSNVWLASSGFVVSRRREGGNEFLTVNLSQIVFYVAIELTETTPGSGVYIGYGYDFWWSADHDNPPRVNYQFIAKLDSNDRSKIDFTWNIFPLIRDTSGSIIQGNPLLRLGSLEPQWLQKLSEEGESIPHLKFRFSTRIK